MKYYVISGKNIEGKVLYFYYKNNSPLRETINFQYAYKFKDKEKIKDIINHKEFQKYLKLITKDTLKVLEISEDVLITNFIKIKI